MAKVTISESHEVPDGEYCADWRNNPVNACQFMQTKTSVISDYDARHGGMGSGGSITHYSCALFRVGLDHRRHEGERAPWVTAKCNQCKVFADG